MPRNFLPYMFTYFVFYFYFYYLKYNIVAISTTFIYSQILESVNIVTQGSESGLFLVRILYYIIIIIDNVLLFV